MVEKLEQQSDTRAELSRRDFLASVAALAAGTTVAEAQERKVDYSRSIIYQDFDPIPVGHGNFKFIGVSHIGHTFAKYAQRFDERVRSAPFIMLEYFTQRMRDETPHIYRERGILSRKQLNDDASFFSSIGYLAAKHGKDILVVNPHSGDDKLGQLLLELEMRLSDFPVTVGIAAAGTSIGSAYKLSRRDFVGGSLWGAAASPLIRQTMENYEEIQSLDALSRVLETYASQPRALRKEDAEKFVAYLPHMLRWRDLASAKGTQRAFELFADEVKGKTVPGIYGLAHLGMKKHLENKSSIELETYPYLNLVGDRMIRRWRWDKDNARFRQAMDPVPY